MLYYRIDDPDTGRPAYAIERGGRFCRVLTPFSQWLDRLETVGELEIGEEMGPFEDHRLLAPTHPSKVVCIGLNYRHHAEEMDKAVPDEPLMFLKPPSAVQRPGAPIERPSQANQVDHEGELAVVIGRRAKGLSVGESQSVVVGYTCANDVTARDIQRRENRYTRAKGFDTFCPLGPALVAACAFEPAEHRLECRVDGKLRQSSPLNDFIFAIPRVVSFVSQVMTLEPGDVILTGTPAGVGPLEAGQVVSVEIDGIGRLENPVI